VIGPLTLNAAWLYRRSVPTLTIKLPEQEAQTVFNMRRWEELLADPELAKIEGRIETDRHGHIIMSPPPAARHGSYQSEIAYLLRTLMPEGRVLTECPISTADGVKAADVAWASPECLRDLGNRVCFPKAPEICVEVLSPGNIEAEIQEKKALYFDAGANDVWICSESGAMNFLSGAAGKAMDTSRLCPQFPRQVLLR
jgi:Uma2 family endonuclease